MASPLPSAAPHPFEHGDADLGHGEARGRRGQGRVALLGLVDRSRRLERVARGRSKGGQIAASAPGVASSVAVVDTCELAVEGVKVPDGEGGAEGGETLLEVGAVDLFFVFLFFLLQDEVEVGEIERERERETHARSPRLMWRRLGRNRDRPFLSLATMPPRREGERRERAWRARATRH